MKKNEEDLKNKFKQALISTYKAISFDLIKPGKLDKNRKEFVDLLNRQIQNASSQRMFNSSGLTEVLSRLKRTAETFCYGGLAKTKRSVTKEDYDKKWKFYIAPYMPPDFDQVNRRLS